MSDPSLGSWTELQTHSFSLDNSIGLLCGPIGIALLHRSWSEEAVRQESAVDFTLAAQD